MNIIDKLNKDNKINSLELLEQINLFRKQDGNKEDLAHRTLLGIIRDEFMEEVTEQKILLSEEKNASSKVQVGEYKDASGKKNIMYILTFNQARQILARESRIVRKAVFKYIEKLENEIKQLQLKEIQELENTCEKSLIECKDLKKENEKLEHERGNGKEFKSILFIEWWGKYFFIDKRGFVKRLEKELILLSNELGIEYDGIYPAGSSTETLVFSVRTYEVLKARLEKDNNFEIMSSYRRII